MLRGLGSTEFICGGSDTEVPVRASNESDVNIISITVIVAILLK